jgi:peptide/nickel transport system permease protein
MSGFIQTAPPRGDQRGAARWSSPSLLPIRGAPLLLWFACIWLGALALLALFATMLPLHDPLRQHYGALNAAPSFTYWLGTDTFGRDIFARAIFGARISMVIALIAPLLGLAVGLAIGMLGGYFGRWIDAVVGLFTDVLMAFPNIVLATVIITFAGGSLPVMICVIAFYTLPRFIRVSRATTIVFAHREFVTAARAQGASDLRILIREILPNVVVPLATLTLTLMSFAILIEGGLSFLGLGIPPPTPTWGQMIAEGVRDLPIDPKISLIPAAFVFLTILSFNIIGERLRGASDVKASNL